MHFRQRTRRRRHSRPTSWAINDIFDAFKQESHGVTRNFEGIGLGLTDVRHLVDLLMEGSVTVESKKGRGSCFTVRLPATRHSEAGLSA